MGLGYSVEIHEVIEEDGTPRVFGVSPFTDAPDQKLGFDPHNPVFGRALKLAGRDLFFRLALRDFLRAITDPTDCATYCYRAIEGIKSAFVFKTGKDRWDDMHAALGTDRESIESTVKRRADPVRHGNWIEAPVTTAAVRWEMLWLTREILRKFLDREVPPEAPTRMDNRTAPAQSNA